MTQFGYSAVVVILDRQSVSRLLLCGCADSLKPLWLCKAFAIMDFELSGAVVAREAIHSSF